MVRFLRALLVPEEGILEPATVESMLSRHHGFHPSLTGRALGWSEDSSVTPRRLLHSGSLDGFSSAIVLVPERAGGVFVAFNGNADVWPLIRSILDRRFPAEPVLAPPIEAPEAPVATAAGRYAPAALPTGSFDKARLLFEQIEVGMSEEGELVHRGRGYRPEGGGVYRSETGRLALIRHAADRTYLLEEGGRWLRLPWHAHWPLHLAVLLVLCAGLVFQAAGRSRLSGRGAGEDPPPGGRLERLAAALNLLFLAGIASLMSVTMARGGGVLRFEIPWYLVALLALPLVALVLAALSCGAGVLAARREGKDRRPWASLLWRFATPAAFAAFLAYWNLLGFRF